MPLLQAYIEFAGRCVPLSSVSPTLDLVQRGSEMDRFAEHS